jgi:hypothetical protein
VAILPGQSPGRRWAATGYERGIRGLVSGTVHALRPSVHSEGLRRQTLCGALAMPAPIGRHFSPVGPRACKSCAASAALTPLTVGINPSQELSDLRAVLRDVVDAGLEPRLAVQRLVDSCPPEPVDVNGRACPACHARQAGGAGVAAGTTGTNTRSR